MPQPADAPGAHAVGLPPGERYVCRGCGNLTRFDVVVTERASRFWHAALSGEGTVEQSTTESQVIESVTCRWCGSADRVTTEPVPGAAH